MKPGKLARRVILAVVAVIAISSLTGCVVVPARGYYGGPVYYHAYR